MLAKKKKLSKKEIKEDKLVTTFYEAKSYYEKNQTMIFAVTGAIIVIIFAVLFFTNKTKENDLLASVELSRVVNTYNAGLYQQAIDGKEGTQEIGLLKIVDEFSGTEQGELARIYLANAYFYTEQYEKAMEEYDNYSGSDNLMISAALAGIASCYEVKNDFANAAKYFSKAADVSKFVPSNPDYLLNAGINLIKIENYKEAKVVLNKIKNEYTTAPASRQVDRYLAQLKN